MEEVETKKSQEISRENDLRRLQRQLREASEAANDTETKDGTYFSRWSRFEFSCLSKSLALPIVFSYSPPKHNVFDIVIAMTQCQSLNFTLWNFGFPGVPSLSPKNIGSKKCKNSDITAFVITVEWNRKKREYDEQIEELTYERDKLQNQVTLLGFVTPLRYL